MLARAQVVRWIQNTAAALRANREFLTDLDAAIGDADHGTNMDRGFQAVLQKLPGWEGTDVGGLLKSVGMALMSTVGGASGPLYGTFFLRCGTAAAGKQELSGEDLLAVLSAGVEGILQRGRPAAGDKTMYDALAPALEALNASLEAGEDIPSALDSAVSAAEEGMRATIPMQARKGRASYLGERSMGHQDPGATSAVLLLKALRDAAAPS